jgi:hypothetical protein
MAIGKSLFITKDPYDNRVIIRKSNCLWNIYFKNKIVEIYFLKCYKLTLLKYVNVGSVLQPTVNIC